MEKPCKTCKKYFKTPQKRQIFCSISCGQKSRHSKIIKNCKFCKKEFETCRGTNSRIFCTRDCFHKWNSKDKVRLVCQNCGEEYFKTPSVAINRRSCSKKCKYEMSSRENSVRFKGLYKLPIQQRKQSNVYRELAFLEYGKKCSICSRDDKFLDVHHIDKDRNNNNMENLFVICKGSHRRLHILCKKFKISIVDSLKIIKVIGCLPPNSYRNLEIMEKIAHLAKKLHSE